MKGAALAACAALLLAPGAAAAQEGWEAMLPGIAPGLTACLEGRAGAMVVMAWPMNHGMLGARVSRPGGEREDCVVEQGSWRVESRRPVPPGETLPGEGLRAFMPERRCVDAWRVEDAAGRELGWLAYPGCG